MATVSFSEPLLSVALSAQSLFSRDWDGEGGLKGWRAHQDRMADVPMAPGRGFAFAQKLLELNALIPHEGDQTPIQIHVISRQVPAGSMRFLNSLEHHGLTKFHGHGLLQISYISGASPWGTLRALSPHLYLSTNPASVREVIDKSKGRIGSACLSPFEPRNGDSGTINGKLVVAFDGDAVIFDDDADRALLQGGLEFAKAQEEVKRDTFLSPGPLHGFLKALHDVRVLFGDDPQVSPLKLILVTARGASSQRRVIQTLHHWDIAFDEAHFISGRSKGAILQQAGTVIFFDDSRKNISVAQELGIPAGHVPWGVMNDA